MILAERGSPPRVLVSRCQLSCGDRERRRVVGEERARDTRTANPSQNRNVHWNTGLYNYSKMCFSERVLTSPLLGKIPLAGGSRLELYLVITSVHMNTALLNMSAFSEEVDYFYKQAV